MARAGFILWVIRARLSQVGSPFGEATAEALPPTALMVSALPGGEDFIGGRRGYRCFGGGEEFAADEPAYGRLSGAFGDADGFGEFLIADGDGGGSALLGIFLLLRFLLLYFLLFGGEPDVDEEAGGTAVVADEVAEEDVGDVGVELEHRYTDG
jgi:hypothetical protein